MTRVLHVAMHMREYTSDMYYVSTNIITMTHAINSNTNLLSIDITRTHMLMRKSPRGEKESRKEMRRDRELKKKRKKGKKRRK